MDEPAPGADAEAADDPAEIPTLSFELVCPPAAMARLSRLPALRAARTGRARGQALAMLWLDTADGGLAAEGLVAERQGRGPAVLRRLVPEPGWPGAPGGFLDDEHPPGLVAIASFRGRVSRIPCAEDVTVECISGQIRAVAADQPAARVILAGPPAAVFRLAHALAEDAPLLPAAVGLAEAARALAAQEPPRPAAPGPARLGEAADAGEAVAAALGHLGLAMLHQRDGAWAGAEPAHVHQMRVALRRMRALLRLFRPATGAPALLRLEAELKALAGRLGPARDWDVFLDGIAARLSEAAPGDARLAPLLREARAARDAAYATLREALDEPEFRHLALDLAAAAAWPAAWRATAPAPDAPIEAFGAALLDRRWRRLKKGARRLASLDIVAFHALRIEGKRLRYAAEAFAPRWPGKASRRFLRRLAALQDAMGAANDAEVARGLVGGLPGATGRRAAAAGLVEGWCLAQAAAARQAALAAWEALSECRPFWR
jgi:CHAD domain-containing protein